MAGAGRCCWRVAPLPERLCSLRRGRCGRCRRAGGDTRGRAPPGALERRPRGAGRAVPAAPSPRGGAGAGERRCPRQARPPAAAAAPGAEAAALPGGMWGGGNGSGGESWPWPPCDERLCLALPVRVLVPVTAVCLGLFVVGVAGNVLTVLVIRGYRDMKNTTNLYLGSMAVSDLLILLGLPFDLYRLWRSRPWIFGQLLCRLSHYLSEGCTYCTILHITALTVERYLAICFPLKAKVMVTKRRVKAIIGILWAFAFLSAGPFFFLVDVEQPDNHTDFSRECKPTPQAVESGLLATMFWVTTSYFVLPVICLNVLYGLIGRELWQSNARLRGPNAVLREKEHRQTVKILGESFFRPSLCWRLTAGAGGAGLVPRRAGIVQENLLAVLLSPSVLPGTVTAVISLPHS